MRFAVRSQDPVRGTRAEDDNVGKRCATVLYLDREINSERAEKRDKKKGPRPKWPAEPCGGSKVILNEIAFLPSRGIVRRVLDGVNHRLASSPVSDPNDCCRVTAAA